MLKIVMACCVLLFFNLSTTAAKPNNLNEEFVPQWAKSVIWYQIFPERFRNGDLSNDPQKKDILLADPREPAKTWQVHPWSSDWYQLLDYELNNGEPELWKHLSRRRYGGDLQGIIDKLDYLQNIGISAIYLNPVFDSPSLHKYDAATYHHIDPNFGPDPEGDRQLISQENPLVPETWVWTTADRLALKLIDEVHKRGMRIIFDGVFNHMGKSSFALKDLEQNQENSAYKDWFIVKSFRDKEKGTTFEYSGWANASSLPEFKEDHQGIVSGPKEYIFNATKRWMNPDNRGTQYGIDGWRLDVAYDVSHQFWKSWRRWVRSINPQAYMTAEIFKTPEKAIAFLEGDEFDGEMNYNFAFAAAEFFFNPKASSITVSEFDNKLSYSRTLYPKGVAYVTQNLFGSHDTNRIASHIVNRGIENFRSLGNYQRLSKAADNPDYQVRKPNHDEIQLQKLFIIMQMTYVGAPMIYYGDEVGMWGATDPDDRKPMIWDDIKFKPEVYLPNQQKRPADSVAINAELLNHYKNLIAIRNNNKALQVGDFKSIIIDNKNSIYGFKRSYENASIFVILNNSSLKQKLQIKSCKVGTHSDALNKMKYPVVDDKINVTIKKKWAAILVCKNNA